MLALWAYTVGRVVTENCRVLVIGHDVQHVAEEHDDKARSSGLGFRGLDLRFRG